MRTNSFPQKGDGVVVTGAARGIGAATVKTLVEQGIFVIAADANGSMLSETLKRIDPAGELTFGITADVTKEEECQKVAKAAADRGIRIKGLVNNAAVGAFNMSVEKTSFDEWQRII